MVQVNVRVPPGVYERILQEAQASGGTVTSIVLLALHELFERDNSERGTQRA